MSGIASLGKEQFCHILDTYSQLAFTCSKPKIGTLKKGVKCVQSQH